MPEESDAAAAVAHVTALIATDAELLTDRFMAALRAASGHEVTRELVLGLLKIAISTGYDMALREQFRRIGERMQSHE